MKPTSTLIATTVMILVASVGLVLSVTQLKRNQPARAAAPNYSVTMFDVGQGDALFIQEADGTQILVDGGPDASVLAHLGRTMKPWDRDIDLLVATHPHADHITGLIHVLERYEVHAVLFPVSAYESSAWDTFLEAVAREGAVIPDTRTPLTEYVSVLYPSATAARVDVDDVNEASFLMQIDDGAHITLLTGDAGDPVEELLLETGGLTDIDVLKVGHHGSAHSSSRAFLEILEPEYALISAGEDNDYHHPHLSTLRRLEYIGAEIWRTDLHGNVTVKSYDDRLEVE